MAWVRRAWRPYSDSSSRLPVRRPARKRHWPARRQTSARRRLRFSLFRRWWSVGRRAGDVGLHLKLGIDQRFTLLDPRLRLADDRMQLDLHGHRRNDPIQRSDVAEELADRMVAADDSELVAIRVELLSP